MPAPIVLASGSEIRAKLLSEAAVPFETETARVDEESVRDALVAEGAKPRDMADALAELKADRVARRRTDAVVIGCDQVLSSAGTLFAKPSSIEEAGAHLRALRGRQHVLSTAAVIFEDGRPVWRHVSEPRLTMRNFSDDYLDAYLARNWDNVRHCVGAYELEAEGVRLFSRVDGDFFAILGLPLIEVLSYLTLKGNLPG